MHTNHKAMFLTTLAAALALLVFAGSAVAGALQVGKSRTYHFGTHPARTTVTFVSEADLETIHGVTHSIQGSVSLDKTGKRATGKLRIGVATLRTGIDLRDEHLRSSHWLDVRKFPYLDLKLLRATPLPDGRRWSFEAQLTIKGVTRTIRTTARIRAIPTKVAKSLGAGSWVRVRTNFPVTLSDFGISIPQRVGAKVGRTWAVGVDLYGTTARPGK